MSKEKLILSFLEKHNISFVISGNNVRTGNINIQCPFCGNSDKSQHMGINLETGMYGCWRNSEHRGKNLQNLIKELLHCSWAEANLFVNEDYVEIPETDNFGNFINNIFDKREYSKIETIIPDHASSLFFPPSFRDIVKTGASAKFWRYLEGRGFDDVGRLVSEYGLKCCLSGDWEDRIIIPVYVGKRLVSWTARSVNKNAYLRYKDLSISESIIPIKNCLANYDDLLEGGDILFICEGPFDFLKMSFYLPEKHKATCFFTKTMTKEQMYSLKNVSGNFREIRILLDEDAYFNAIQLGDTLSFLKKVSVHALPKGIKDPGDLTKGQVFSLTKEVMRGEN